MFLIEMCGNESVNYDPIVTLNTLILVVVSS